MPYLVEPHPIWLEELEDLFYLPISNFVLRETLVGFPLLFDDLLVVSQYFPELGSEMAV